MKYFLICALICTASLTCQSQEEESVGGILPFPLPGPKIIFASFTPQISIKQLSLVFTNVNITGLDHCHSLFGAEEDLPTASFSIINCSSALDVRSGFIAGGHIFNLPVVGRGNLSIHLDSFYVMDIMEHPIQLNGYKVQVEGLNPGSDTTYLLNDMANSLQQDLEQVIMQQVCKVTALPFCKNLGNAEIVLDNSANAGEIFRTKVSQIYKEFIEEIDTRDDFDKLTPVLDLIKMPLEILLGNYVSTSTYYREGSF